MLRSVFHGWIGGAGARRLSVAAAAMLSAPTRVLAQAAAPAAAPVSMGRSLTLEYIIVVVMIGLALFAVCRGSRRN